MTAPPLDCRTALLVTDAGAGHLNHCVALLDLLRPLGWHVQLVTAPEARAHLARLDALENTRFLDCLSLSFDRADPERRSHLRQQCDEGHLLRATVGISELIAKTAPEFVIGRGLFSVRLAARRSAVPYLAYWQGGPSHLVPNMHPAERAAPARLSSTIEAVARRLGLRLGADSLFQYLRSETWNLVRGVPGFDSLSPAQRLHLPSNTLHVGLPTADGPHTGCPPDESRFVAYATFGTMCFDVRRYRAVLEVAERMGEPWLIACPYVRAELPEPLPRSATLLPYVPNDWAARRSTVVVHHGGYGTLITAALVGRPSVVIPENTATSCQGIQADFLRGLGVAVVARRATVRDIESAVSQARGPRYRLAAEQLARNLRERDLRQRRRLLETLSAWSRGIPSRRLRGGEPVR